MILRDRLASAISSLHIDGDNGDAKPVDICLILGTGLNDMSALFEHSAFSIEKQIPYEAINHFPHSSVQSHHGQLLLATFKDLRIAIFQGRFHLYEGWSALDTAFPVYLAKQLGANTLIVSNAAGALNPAFDVASLMLMEDHLNFTGHNPLLGWEDEAIGSRFPDMSRCYNKGLATITQQAADTLGIKLNRGIYAAVLGPSLETSAERRFLRSAGADAVGMSTAMEVIAAKQCSMKVLGISAITNVATGLADQPEDSIERVLANAGLAAAKLAALLPTVLDKLKR